MKNVVAAAAVALGLSTGLLTALAAPAAADELSDQIDQQFLTAIKDRGIRIKAADALELGHSTCAVLGRGGSVSDALFHVQNTTEWTSQKDISTFGSIAVQVFCPTALKK